MGKLNATLLRYLTHEHFRILVAIEMGMRNHQLVPHLIAASIANLKHGGVQKLLRELCNHGLLCYERGKRYDGYRLTNMGYDYLALHSLTKRGTLAAFGNQIGVGKESNIFIVSGPNDENLCLKLHRLGRICFRNVQEKRDYHHNRKISSWLYLSRISAKKEFAYMNALYNREFPVPKPIDSNRHCVLMELVQGKPLAQLLHIEDVEALYNELMNIIVKFADSGVIHGDFNEFNIMITDDEKPIIIDFPQMVSIAHENAQMYFERDVNCIRSFFLKRFKYESELFPQFTDIQRNDELDLEISCSGVKQYLKELKLNHSSESSDDDYDDVLEASELVKNLEINEKLDEKSVDSENIINECNWSDTDSCISSATTIHPDEIKSRVKKQLSQAQKRQTKLKHVAKGEANCVTRSRRENLNAIKQSFDFGM